MSESAAETLDFNKLPEACIAHVLSLTSPRDSCRSSAVSTAFRTAVDSDTVWEEFLPSGYQDILNRTVEPMQWSSRRDLYFKLCDPILIDGGKMSFQLEKSSGAKCYMISSKQLYIVWGDTPEYWTWITMSDARFPEVASLRNVCWLEIHGKIDSKMLTPKKKYAAYLVYKLDESTRGLSFPLQETSVKVGMHESKHNVRLDPENSENPENLGRWSGRMFRRRLFRQLGSSFFGGETEASRDGRVPSVRQDGWLEIEMGEFCNGDCDDGEIDICLSEVEGGHWKCGLLLLGIELRPKLNPGH